MIIAGIYSFNNGIVEVETKYPDLLDQIKDIIGGVNAEDYKTKESREKTMPGQMLYSPSALNKAINDEFVKHGWHKHRVDCQYSKDYYTAQYCEMRKMRDNGAFREIDFIKDNRKLGVEVQFGKYAFAVYNVAAKMTIFKKLGIIDTGVEIVPIRQLAQEMSTGVTYFEQFIWDLEHRGISDIDIPVLILGIDSEAHVKANRSQSSLF